MVPVSDFEEGDRVRHAVYGLGVVVRVLSFSDQRRVRVAWDTKLDSTSVLADNLAPTVEGSA